MTEVGQRFSTRTEERLLAVVYTLQQRTYKTGLSAAAPVPDAFKKELAGAHAWCGHVRFLPLDRVSACHTISIKPLQACARRVEAVTQARASWHASSSSLHRTWSPARLAHHRRWAT